MYRHWISTGLISALMLSVISQEKYKSGILPPDVLRKIHLDEGKEQNDVFTTFPVKNSSSCEFQLHDVLSGKTTCTEFSVIFF